MKLQSWATKIFFHVNTNFGTAWYNRSLLRGNTKLQQWETKNILSWEYEFWYRLVQQVIASWGYEILVPFGTGHCFMGIQKIWYRLVQQAIDSWEYKIWYRLVQQAIGPRIISQASRNLSILNQAFKMK